MKIAKIIDIAEDIIEIGETIKQLAINESYIDFNFRASQLYMYAQVLKDANKEIYKFDEE